MNYLIPIGGTGIRVMRSFLNLLVATHDVNDSYKVMCVDSDDTNGDFKELENMIKNYRNIDGLFPKIELTIIDGEERCIWSPLSGDKRKDKRSTMEDMISESQMSDKAKNVLNFLYTKPEREKVLEGGFYGHTSIGSYFMAQEVVKGDEYTEAWRDFFDNVKKDDKIFIIGSLFGGTGASGVPTISRIIKDNVKTKNIPLGALFVMPYFKPQKADDIENALPIDWTTFTMKTKVALSFYLEQKFDEIFDTMYFIGEDADSFMNVPYNDCGTEQKNKPAPIELFAATAVSDYFGSEPNENFVAKFLTKEQQTGNSVQLTQKMLNEICNNSCYFNKIARFLQFSIAYCKYLYPCIKDDSVSAGWLGAYRKIDNNEAASLDSVCRAYINWLKDMLILNGPNGRPDYTSENSCLNWFYYKAYSDLYNTNKALESNETGIMFFKKHRVINSDGLNELTEIIKKEDGNPLGQDNNINIIDVFLNNFSSGHRTKDSNDKTDLKMLMDDIIELLEKESEKK